MGNRMVDGVAQRCGDALGAALGDLVAAVLPGRCPGCGARAEPVCETCLAEMRSALPAPPPLGIEAWAAPFAYEGVARELVARLKYRNCRSALPWLAEATARSADYRFTRRGGPGGGATPVPAVAPAGERMVDVVTWAPTTATRRRERGFDHGEILARAVARRLHLPAGKLLDRMDRSPQTGRPAAQRRFGPRFRARRSLTGLRVLLVDDVATTGATLSSAARALRGAGSDAVLAVTACRTPPPGGRPR